jgi:hypothetical protein
MTRFPTVVNQCLFCVTNLRLSPIFTRPTASEHSDTSIAFMTRFIIHLFYLSIYCITNIPSVLVIEHKSLYHVVVYCFSACYSNSNPHLSINVSHVHVKYNF